MAENLPSFQEGGQAPLLPLTYLPHAHPQTSFSNPDQDLDRQAMPPPTTSMVNNSAATLGSSTLSLRPHDYNPDIAPSLLHDPQVRDTWMAGKAHDFHELYVRMDQIKSSVEMVRRFGNQAELAFIYQGLELYTQSRSLCDDMHTRLYGFGGPGHEGALKLSRDWNSHLSAEFNHDIAGAETVAKFFHDRKALCERKMNILNQMTQLEHEGASMPRGIINPLSNPFVPLAGGVLQPVHNQNFLPMETPLASVINFPPQDSYQAQRIIDNLPTTSNGVHSLVAAQNQSYFDQGRQVQELQHLALQGEASPLNSITRRCGITSAFSHQFDIVGTSNAPYQISGGRTNSFDRGATMHGRQEFLAGIHAGYYDRVHSRRPTVASQGSYDGNLRRWNSHSPQRQPQHFYASAVEQWQQNTTYGQGNAVYGAPYGGSHRQSQHSHSRDNSAGHVQWRTPVRSRHSQQISRETSPRTSRGLSPAKVLEPTGSKSPRKFVPAAQSDDSHSISSADHSHPIATSPMPSSSMSVDMLGEWGRQHTPNTSERRNSRLSDLDVPTFKLDEAAPSSTSVKSAWTPSLTATAGPIPPHLLWNEDPKPSTFPSSYEYTKSVIDETHPEKSIKSKQPAANQQKEGNAKRPQADTANPPPSEKTFDTIFSPTSPVKMAEVDVMSYPPGEAPERAQESDWQVAGPRTKKTGKEPATQRSSRHKGTQKRLKEDQPRREPASTVPRKTHKDKDKATSDDLSQEHKMSVRGAKTKRLKKEASGEGRDEYGSQRQNTGTPYEGRRSKKGKGKVTDNDSSSLEQSYLPDLAGEVFPSLSSPAADQSTTTSVQLKDDADEAELAKMSWSSALKAQNFRVEAEKVRVAAVVLTTVDGRDASGIRRISTGEINKTPAPKGRASSGDLRATATPFTPPPAGQSLLITGPEMDFSAMHLDTNPLCQTWAARAALAANVPEEEVTVLPVLQLTKTERKSIRNAAKRAARANAFASENDTAISVSQTTRSGSSARASSIDFESKLCTAPKKDLNKLSLSEHIASMSLPPSTVGSVSSPSLTSVRSLPSTPVVRTWAHRAASAALYTAPPSTAKAERPRAHSGNIPTPKIVDGSQIGTDTPAASAPGLSRTVHSSAAKSNLSATASTFTYAAKLAAPVPPSTSFLANVPCKETADAKTAKAKSTPSSVRTPGKKGGKDKEKKPASPNSPSSTIDASLMMISSPDSARASFASTATTSTSSATLVSSETVSSEGASSAGVRDNTDIGGSKIVRIKGPYRPARGLDEDGYNAPPLTPSSAWTWTQGGNQRPEQPPLMDHQASSDSKGESTLTTSLGSRHAGSEADRPWRDAKSKQLSDVSGAALPTLEQNIPQHREVVKNQEQATRRQSPHNEGSEDPEGHNRRQREFLSDIRPHDATIDAAEGGGALDDTPIDHKFHNSTAAGVPGEPGSDVSVSATGTARHRRGSKGQKPKRIPKQETLGPSEIFSTQRLESEAGPVNTAQVTDSNKSIKAGAFESKQTEARTSSTDVNEGDSSNGYMGRGGAQEIAKSKDNAGYESDDSTGTVTGTPTSLYIKKNIKVEIQKPDAVVLDTSSKKIMWADADDEEDEWAGFEELTTPATKQL